MKVKLSNYPVRWHEGSYFHGGVKTEVDGLELPEVRDINLNCLATETPLLTVHMNAFGLDIELDARVTIILHAESGERVEIEQVANNKIHLRTVQS